MKRGKNLDRMIIGYVKAFLLFLLAAVISIMVFFFCVQKTVDENVNKSLKDNVVKQSRHFQTIIKVQFRYLESTADYIGQSEDLFSEENMALIHSLWKKTKLDRVTIIDTEGMAHYDNGEVKSVQGRKYLEECLNGNRSLSDPLESRLSGETKVVLGVPIFRNGKIVGMLGGSYDLSELSRILFGDIYHGSGFSFITDKDGNMVSCDNSEKSQFFEKENNLFAYSEKESGKEVILDEIKKDFQNGRKGCMTLPMNGETWRTAYVPLGYNDWMVCFAVSGEEARSNFRFIQEYEIILASVLIICVLILLLAFIRASNKRQEELLSLASTDVLTGLYNKQTTENQIHSWLLRTQEFQEIQAFIIMDIDYFKEINDSCGHSVGDEVLRQIGECLKKVFHSTDIIGRIGGDEFVVFMKNAGTMEIVEYKAQQLCASVRQLVIPELEGKKITTSIGISCWPDDGETFLELYKHADMALYEAKHLGRNGYSFFQGEEDNKADRYVHKAYTEINPLTGLYFNRAFFRKADDLICNISDDEHILLAIDIERFRLFNRLYGRSEGDRLLLTIADCLRELLEKEEGVAGYLGGDNFAILLPACCSLVEELQRNISEKMENWSQSVAFLPAFGVFRIFDKTVPSAVMYDRATIALSHVYGNYSERICVFDESMVEQLEEEISLISEVKEGLQRREFIFYVQPQCHISSGKIQIVGGECLVRWMHPKKGLLSPGEFVPVLEKSGFVAELDRYIWKKVCRWQKSWVERGNIPIPLSVNVSRIDIFSMDVPEYFRELTEEYQLSPSLLKVEIMESTCAEEDNRITETITRLQEMGFTVLMDDFGSAYSSLNMLNSVPVDVIKLDLKFLEFENQNAKKGMGILESVISMTRQMGLPVVMEGVETKKQERFLLDMGCDYVQGYYYYRPMSVADFENLISDYAVLDLRGFMAHQVNNLQIRDFINKNVISDVMLNHILGPSAFYDVYDNVVSLTSVNEEYCRLTGMSQNREKRYEKRFWNHVADDDRKELLLVFRRAFENPEKGAVGFLHYLRSDGEMIFVQLRCYFIREREGHRTFYGSLTDVTPVEDKKKLPFREKDNEVLSEQEWKEMTQYYDEIPCGIGIGRVILDENDNPLEWEPVYLNYEAGGLYETDRKRSVEALRKLFFKEQSEFLDACRQAAFGDEILRFHAYSQMTCRYLCLTLYPYKTGYAGMLVEDQSQGRSEDAALRSMLSLFKEIHLVNLRDNHYRMIYPDPDRRLERGNYKEAINRRFGSGVILRENEENVRKFLSPENVRKGLKESNVVEYSYRRKGENGPEWCRTIFTLAEEKDGEPLIAALGILGMENWIYHQDKLRLGEIMEHLSEGLFIYEAESEKILYVDNRIVELFGCSSREEFLEYVGGTFRGMVHPDDLNRIENEIVKQIEHTERKMDYVEYRIIRKDGSVIWVDDYGHLVKDEKQGSVFYVFIAESKDQRR